jgi:sigma-B regulation protein RsbU (phosphoserine phosphatase)
VNHLIVVSLFRAKDLFAAFTKSKIYKLFLVDKSGIALLGPDKSVLDEKVINNLKASTLPEAAFDVDSKQRQIVSYTDAGIDGMRVVATVDEKLALSAVDVLLTKSILFFIAMIASTVIISVFASVKLTASLRELYEATKMVALGKFDVRVAHRSNDELGSLADGFNSMAAEISRLVIEAGLKARMASELETVKMVQETLFPSARYQSGKFSLAGHFEPASECGGDWWNYSQMGDKLFLWIGDATGHGAPAAMVTSAAKSASTIIETLPLMTPGKALEILNKAIHETSKGKILMTFFIASIDVRTGELIYANASHEPPLLARSRNNEGPLERRDLIPLIEVNGARLGDRRSSSYEEHKIQLNEGDLLVFYTDGVIDLKNKSGKNWGERGFLQSVCNSAALKTDVHNKIGSLVENINSYRDGVALVDDVTLMLCQCGVSQ